MKNSEDNTEKYSFEIGPIRPPNEGGESSLLIRPTRNCSWNRCAFCPFYDGKKFQIRDVDEMKREIDTIKRIRDMMVENSVEINKVPVHCRLVVSRWIQSGEKTAFIQDSNSLIMPTDQLVEVLEYLVETFPSLERITSYARSDTLVKKDLRELKKIRDAGLNRLHIGLESGDDKVLDLVNKGVTAEEHIEAGRKAKEAGFELSEYVMPGLGGKKLSEEHALSTAKVLNQIDPDYIRMRPLSIYPNTEIHQKIEKGEFQLNSLHERLEEVKIIVETLEVSSNLCFDHSWNSWRDRDGNLLFDMDYEGYKLPEERDHILNLVEEGLKVDGSRHLGPRSRRSF
ncbi:MAG: radical SAM protein [Candidatus Natronoplasma sp.]